MKGIDHYSRLADLFWNGHPALVTMYHWTFRRHLRIAAAGPTAI